MTHELERNQVKDLLRRAVTAPSARDEQSSVGPSELGDPCDFCLGVGLTRKYPEFRPEGVEPRRSFSLKAWNGTAVHSHLEANLARLDATEDGPPWYQLMLEPTVTIWELEHYGTITGHVDLVYMLWHEVPENLHQVPDYAAVVDHKTIDKDKLRQMRLTGVVPDKHVFQDNIYGYGLEHYVGVRPTDVGLHFIPRDSNSAEDIWPVFDRYRPEVAEMALERLETVWHRVRSGELMKLSSHDECFNCNRW